MQTIESLIELNIEIEGLLRVLSARGTYAVRQLLDKKFEQYSRLFECLQRQCPELEDDNITSQVEIADEVKNQEAESAEIPDETQLATEAIRRGTDSAALTIDSEFVGDVVNDQEVTAEQELPFEVEHVPEPAVGDNLEEHTLMPPTEESREADSSVNADEESIKIEDAVPDASKDNIRVDELISRREARELKRAFTLNDKFRFRRELFGNNDSMFADTLNALMAMKSIDEATEYLYDDLGWDPQNEDVKDFVAIVRNHFADI